MNEYLPQGALKDALIYFVTVIVVCEIGRFVTDRLFDKRSTMHKFAIEFFGTLQVTTTIYENAVIFIHYGQNAFAFTLFTMGIIFGLTTRGAFCGPLNPIEQLVFARIRLGEFVRIILSQITAGLLTYRFARTIWIQTFEGSEAHANILGVYQNCGFNHPFPLYAHLAFELVGAFVVRHVFARVMPKLSGTRFELLFPAFFMALIFTGSASYVGDQALDPLVASILFFGCRGLDQQYFILIYWIAPTIGWLASAYLDNQSKVSSSKKLDKKKKKQN